MKKIILFMMIFISMALFSGCGIPPFDDPDEESDDCVSVSGTHNTVYYSNGINLLNNNKRNEEIEK